MELKNLVNNWHVHEDEYLTGHLYISYWPVQNSGHRSLITIVGHCSIDKNWDKHEFHLKLTLYFGLWFGLGDTISVVYLL